ncbi:AI-2E family transporter [Streptomyces althioticus]|uniref:AI-2E family transporter n=1 Tax=Streptomyces althioticus TaxID=83380 RepID=UPI003797F528
MSTPPDPAASPPPGPRTRPTAARVPGALRTAAAYAWRLIAVGVVVRAAFSVLGQFHRIAVAVFLGLVFTAVLRPVADLFARFVPRALAVAGAVVGGVLLVVGGLALVGEAIAGQRTTLEREFVSGVERIERRLEQPPFRLSPTVFDDLQSRAGELLSSHRATVLSTALSGVGRVVEVLTVLALALFCAVFFVHSGDRYWRWFCEQVPTPARRTWSVAGDTAWRTFTGYTHGILLVAVTNAVLVGLALFALGVPLAVPLAVLEFVAAFVPLIGSPVALAVAAVVALATKGPVTALVVVALIVVIAQLEGHLLHPLVLSWAVRLHPVVVALSVVAGAVAAGVVGAVVAVPLVATVWSVGKALREKGPAGT